MSNCLRCKHWIQGETPPWARALGMAICAEKRTKAVTLNHWVQCEKFTRTSEPEFRRRVGELQAMGVKIRADGLERRADVPNRLSTPRPRGLWITCD